MLTVPAEKNKQLAPMLLRICPRLPIGNLNCGQKVNVLERQGAWLKITLPNGAPRYIEASLVSQLSDKPVPFDIESGIHYVEEPKCDLPSGGAVAPHIVYQPDPDYPDEARKRGVQGTVVLSVTVGTDGKAHNFKVESTPGYGLEKSAVEAVKQWRWEPALANGKPADVKVNVSIQFSLPFLQPGRR